MPFAGAQPITGSFIPQWGTRESPRPSLQPPKPPLPRGALVWLGRDRDLLLPGVPLPHAHADLPRHGDGVHGADRAAAAEPEAPARPILPPQPPASYRNAQAKAWQGGGGRVPREASSLRTGPTSGLGSSRQHRPLHPQGLQTLQPKGPPQSAWQGKGPSARVSCLEGSRGPGRAKSRRLLAPGVSQ